MVHWGPASYPSKYWDKILFLSKNLSFQDLICCLFSYSDTVQGALDKENEKSLVNFIHVKRIKKNNKQQNLQISEVSSIPES